MVYRGSFNPGIEILEPDGIDDKVVIGDTYTIKWTDYDPDDNAEIRLYYDDDTNFYNGKWPIDVTGTIKEDPDGTNDTYVWIVTNVQPGEYYICGVIDDGRDYPIYDYSGNGSSITNGKIIIVNEEFFVKVTRPNQPDIIDLLCWSGSNGYEYSYNYPYTIKWEDFDNDMKPDSKLGICWDFDKTNCDGVLITNNINEDDEPNEYNWEIRRSEGIYWIYITMTNEKDSKKYDVHDYGDAPIIYTPGAVICDIKPEGKTREIKISFSMIDIYGQEYGVKVEYKGGSAGEDWKEATIRHPVTKKPYRGWLDKIYDLEPLTPLKTELVWLSHLDTDEGSCQATNYVIRITPTPVSGGNGFGSVSEPFSVDNSLISSTINQPENFHETEYYCEDGATYLGIPANTFNGDKVEFITTERLKQGRNISEEEWAKIEEANRVLEERGETKGVSIFLDNTLRRFTVENLMGETIDENINSNGVDIKIPYPKDEELGDINESLLRIYYLDEEKHKWRLLKNCSVNINENYVQGRISQLGIYRIIEVNIIKDLSYIIIYPNPYYPEETDYLKIDYLPIDCNIKVRIYTISGELVRVLDEKGTELEVNEFKIKAYWNGKNDCGRDVATGVYFCIVESDIGNYVGKFALIR